MTTAVIVAAGKGDRLAEQGLPKPLVPVVGVPLIGRVMACAAKAGIRRFLVVIGHEARTMRAHLARLVPDGCELELLENPRFDLPNGVSLKVAVDALQEPFALLMSDHIFSPERLRLALEHYAAHGSSLLVVESAASFGGDLEDATLVASEGGKVRAIGKSLERYDAIDTGMFVLCRQRIAAALRTALETVGEGPSISDGMRNLAHEGELEALELSGGYWQDVDTAADIGSAEACLYRHLRKDTDGFLASLINRRISLFLSTRLWRLGVTPNIATSFTLLLGLAAGLAFAQGSAVAWGLLGATLFQLQSICDGVDGELARLLHKESRLGFWYDVSADNLTLMAVLTGIATGLASDQVPGPWPLLGGIAVLGVAASFAVLAPLLNPSKETQAALGRAGMLRNLVDQLSRRDFTYLLFPLALLGWLGAFLWMTAIGTWAYAVCVLGLRLRAARSEADGSGPGRDRSL